MHHVHARRRPGAVAGRVVAGALAAALALTGLALVADAPAEAAAPTVPWGVSAGGSVANVTVSAATLNVAGLAISTSAARAASQSDPRASGISQNIGATAVGLPTIPVLSKSVTAGGSSGAGGTASDTIVGATTGLVNFGALTTTNEAHWVADSACVVSSKLAGSSTGVASVSVLPSVAGFGGPLFSSGQGTTTGSTTLSLNSGSNYGVTSTATGSIAGVTVLGGSGAGGVSIGVAGVSTLTAASTGKAAGTASYLPAAVTVNGTLLPAGGSVTIPVVGGTVTVKLNTPTVSSSGPADVTASVSLLTVSVNLPLITASIDVLPLTATVSPPIGGIDCPPPPAAPVIAVPADNSITASTTPTISGTAVAGSTVTVSSDGSTVGTTTATAGGTWSLTPAPALGQGLHLITATATTVSGTSAPSNTVHLTVDSIPPVAPTLVNPPDGSVTNNARPPITGTAEKGSTVLVTIDGTQVGTTPASASDGSFSFTPPATLSPGPHTASVTAQDAAGNVSTASATHTFTIDTTAPDAPVVQTPANESVTSNRTPPLSGTAEAGSTVRLTVTGQNHAAQVVTTTATAGGTFSVAAPTLADDTYTVSATATDAAGNTSAVSNTNTFTVDGTAPAPPVVVTPANGSTVTTRTPSISGTAEPNSTVTVYLGLTQQSAVAVGTAPADGTGAWALTSPSLADGLHVAFATATDAAGNTSTISNVTAFTVDATPPAAPVVQQPANGSLTNTRTPTLSGTADLDTTVVVSVDGTAVGTATTSLTGTWSLPQPTALADGPHRVSAVAKDAAGNLSPVSNENVFTVDATPPAAPVTVYPADGSSTRNPRPAMGGTTAAGTTVTVSVDGVAHPATVTGTSWTYTPTLALVDGPHTVSATATDAAGNTSVASNTNGFTVDTVAPLPPVIQTPAEGSVSVDTTPAITGTAEPGSTVIVTLDGTALPGVVTSASGVWSTTLPAPLATGPHTATATATDAAGNTSLPSPLRSFSVDPTAAGAPTVTVPADGSTITTRQPVYAGTAPAASPTVSVYVDGLLAGSAPVASGAWTLPQLTGLADGQHTVYAVSTFGVSSAVTTFTVDATPPAAPVITVPADLQHVSTTTPTISGTAEAGSTVTVTIDTINQKTATTTTGPDGRWTLIAPALAEGDHSATAVARDAAGNTSAASAAVRFTVDTTPPAAPTITAPANGSTIGTHTPTYSGRAENGATVAVTVDGTPIGTTTADATTGAWTLPSPGFVADGTHTVTATATDAAGNTGPASATTTFTIDTTPPAPPTIGVPAEGATVTTARPAISGSAEANSLVEVFVDGTSIGTTPAESTGAWTLTPTADLPQGARTATATATDATGNVSSASAPRHFTIDSIPPAAPELLTPQNGTVTNDSRPLFSGTAEPGSTVTLTIVPATGASVTLTTTAASDGTFGTHPTADLPDARYTVSATATDAAGNVGPASSANAFTIDTRAPAVAITAPASGSSISTRRPVISGTAEPGAQVSITLDGAPIGSETVPASGLWSITPPADLVDGPHTAVATATDQAGNQATASSTFTVDTVAPAAPAILAPADGSSISTTTPTISGTAEKGATVAVAIDGTPVGTVTADPGTGAWSVPTTATLTQGAHTATATATDAAGNTSPTATSHFTVDTVAPAAPVISSPADGAAIRDPAPVITGTAEPGSSVTVVLDATTTLGPVTADPTTGAWSLPAPHLGDGSHRVSATATDAAGNVSAATVHTFTVDTVAPGAPTITAPTPNAQLNTHLPRFQGAGDPLTTITVRIDGTTDVATTTVGTNGTWSVTATVPIPDGPHTAVATSTDTAGNATPSAPVAFTVDTVAPAPPAIDYPGNGATIADTTPVITGRAEAGSTVDVRIGATDLGTTVASSTGAWSVPVTTPLTPGSHTATATATDAAGNTSGAASSTFTVDTTAPAAPVIATPADGSTTNRTQPTVSGTGTTGATVSVTIDGQPAGTAPVVGGSWTLVSGVPLAQGAHVVTATQRTGTGPVSATSDPVRFTVDTTAPAAPVISSPVAGSTVNTPQPPITGTAEPGSTVTVFVDGRQVGTTTAAADGSFTVTPGLRIPDGAHTVTATSTDAAGNTGPASTPVSFTVDTTAPVPPVITSPPPHSTTTNRTPTLHGVGEPFVRLLVRANGRVLGETVVAPDGTWTFTVPQPLPLGAYEFTATAIDQAGNVSPASEVLALTIVAPATAAAGSGSGSALQATGLDASAVEGLALSALLLVAAGLLLLVRRARRRPRS